MTLQDDEPFDALLPELAGEVGHQVGTGVERCCHCRRRYCVQIEFATRRSSSSSSNSRTNDGGGVLARWGGGLLAAAAVHHPTSTTGLHAGCAAAAG